MESRASMLSMNPTELCLRRLAVIAAQRDGTQIRRSMAYRRGAAPTAHAAARRIMPSAATACGIG
jgi:hypothetical protein